ncbi:Two component regulator three Y domain-containing protein [Bacillus sp. 3103sda1]|uniref:YqiA/YcfP family alpha/beta fold hydrolase n=1 Tax=Bacillus sp. 3103sda1 TaxID=2953808 RepID=UPI0020A13E91|nr:YqiA/YcfP family alpha/beta fold hydrolase [Bacillus sp. 3103sda1]MCP1126082.1 Two component regulator three Y domain-containing protein [Bacillus sp. 3103sda1]
MFKNEKIFNSEVNIQYLFQKSYKKTENLVIVFSGIPPIGHPPTYNYGRTLSDFDCNKLFILDDFGCRASYYLCKNRDYAIERSVISLINHIIEENGITNVVTCGSSKGGYAALYYGLKYGFNHVIAASPQFFLGTYLMKQTNCSDIATFISGGAEQEDFEYLNSILQNLINETENRPSIFIHMGAGEPHYPVHVQPLVKLLEQRGIDYTLDLGNYNKHSDVGVFFPPILKKKITKLLGYPTICSLESLTGEYTIGATQTFVVETDSKDNKIAWYLFHNKNRIDFKDYSADNTFTFSFEKEGIYQVKAFALNDKDMKVSMISEPITIKENSVV